MILLRVSAFWSNILEYLSTRITRYSTISGSESGSVYPYLNPIWFRTETCVNFIWEEQVEIKWQIKQNWHIIHFIIDDRFIFEALNNLSFRLCWNIIYRIKTDFTSEERSEFCMNVRKYYKMCCISIIEHLDNWEHSDNGCLTLNHENIWITKSKSNMYALEFKLNKHSDTVVVTLTRIFIHSSNSKCRNECWKQLLKPTGPTRKEIGNISYFSRAEWLSFDPKCRSFSSGTREKQKIETWQKIEFGANRSGRELPVIYVSEIEMQNDGYFFGNERQSEQPLRSIYIFPAA